jgi:hypothetical protein
MLPETARKHHCIGIAGKNDGHLSIRKLIPVFILKIVVKAE